MRFLKEKVAIRKMDFLHKFSTIIADNRNAAIVEDINLQHMSKGLKFGKSVYDNSFGLLRNLLAYKLKERGNVFVRVDKFFPTT